MVEVTQHSTRKKKRSKCRHNDPQKTVIWCTIWRTLRKFWEIKGCRRIHHLRNSFWRTPPKISSMWILNGMALMKPLLFPGTSEHKLHIRFFHGCMNTGFHKKIICFNFLDIAFDFYLCNHFIFEKHQGRLREKKNNAFEHLMTFHIYHRCQ